MTSGIPGAFLLNGRHKSTADGPCDHPSLDSTTTLTRLMPQMVFAPDRPVMVPNVLVFLVQPRSARVASRSSEASSLSAVVARARGKRFSSVSSVQS